MKMNPMRNRCALVAELLLVSSVAFAQTPMGTDISYQGQLILDGELVDGNVDFTFSLWDSQTAGNEFGSAVNINDVAVTHGQFEVDIDFGEGAFDGDARWLEVEVRSPSGVGGFVTLSPRQSVTAAPYALQTRGIVATENGDVGLGTDDPLGRLNVAYEFDPAVQFENGGDTTALRQISLNIRHSTGVGARVNAYRDSGNNDGMKLAFATQPTVGGLTDRLTIDADGQVGIGTTSPSATLDVQGNIKVAGGDAPIDQAQETLTTTAAALDGSLWQSFTAGADGLLTQVDLHLHTFTTATSGRLNIHKGEGISGPILSSTAVSFPSGVDAWEAFELSSTPAVAAGSKYTIELLVDSGELRLSAANGDLYPAGHMDPIFASSIDLAFRTYVGGGGVISSGALVGNGAGLTNLPSLWQTQGEKISYADGDIGIGTTNALARVHVSGNNDPTLAIGSTGSPTADRHAGITWQHSDGAGARIDAIRRAGDSDGMELAFYTEDFDGTFARHMTIDPDGQVGIGTETPEEKLDVAGTIRLQGMTFPDGSNQYYAAPSSGLRAVVPGDFIAATSDQAVYSGFELGFGGSFIHTAGSTTRLIAPIQLPEGVQITNVTFNGYDGNASTDLRIRLVSTTFFSGALVDIAQHTSSGTPGHYSQSISTSSQVSNSDRRYMVLVQPVNGSWDPGASLVVSSVLIHYTYE